MINIIIGSKKWYFYVIQDICLQSANSYNLIISSIYIELYRMTNVRKWVIIKKRI